MQYRWIYNDSIASWRFDVKRQKVPGGFLRKKKQKHTRDENKEVKLS